MNKSNSVAIIGAGLSGLALALSLTQHQIPVTIYETRSEPLDIGGAIMLSPNALRVLDKLGVYSRLLPLAYRFQTLHFHKDDGKLLDTFEFGDEKKHQYDGMRVYRFELIKVLLDKLREVGVEPVYGKKFVQVIQESDEGVFWEFADGSNAMASLLVGADGIHSRVRRYIAPNAVPKFTNMIGVTAAVPASQLALTEEDNVTLPLTLMNKTHGAFVAAPQRKDGSEILIGKQCRLEEEPDRAGWDKLTQDKAWSIEFLRKGSEDYLPFVARAVSNIPVESVNLWPFYIIPKLDSWVSTQGRVVVLGDAAHAIPPTAGQGVNQAFEDVYVFSLVLGEIEKKKKKTVDVASAMKAWQKERQARVDGVLELNAKLNQRRLPSQGGAVEVESEGFDMGWLYNVDFDAMVSRIVSA